MIQLLRRAWELSTADRTRMALPGELEDELRAAGFEVETNDWIFLATRILVARRQQN